MLLTNHKKVRSCLETCLYYLALFCVQLAAQADDNALLDKPNVLVIVADDLGYADLGIYGGEINTPHLDKLAKDGMLLTNFHVAATCSPTRSMLMSGVDNHLAGIGNMVETMAENQKGHQGYEGYLNFRVASLAEILKSGGYHTYMTGKWHLGLDVETSPARRGFDKSYVLLEGGAGHFANMLPLVGGPQTKAKYRENEKLIDSLPDDFYSSRFYTEKLIDYIDDNKGDGKPFFGYLAFTAAHWPLQAPESSIQKYKGKYDQGYDVIYKQRLARMAALSHISDDIKVNPPLPGALAWDELGDGAKKVESKKMEIYAAMVDDMDLYVGKIIDYLKQIGEYDNTFILFMSDNGSEGSNLEGWDDIAETIKTCCDNSYKNMGKPNSYIGLGPNWARVSTGPSRMFKGFTSQGGIRAPAIVHYPKLERKGVRIESFVTVKDVMPTVLEVANVPHPGTKFQSRNILPIKGTSMLSVLNGSATQVHNDDYVMGWELFGRRAIRKGSWKIIYERYDKHYEIRQPGIKVGSWQLYNLAVDPTEQNDLSDQYPDILQRMISLWDSYAKENGVIIPKYN